MGHEQLNGILDMDVAHIKAIQQGMGVYPEPCPFSLAKRPSAFGHFDEEDAYGVRVKSHQNPKFLTCLSDYLGNSFGSRNPVKNSLTSSGSFNRFTLSVTPD